MKATAWWCSSGLLLGVKHGANPRSKRASATPYEKTPILAGFLSIVPGLGNIYNGLYVRGLAFCLICSGTFVFGAAREIAVLIPFIIFFWLFNIIDAYRQAMLINYGYTEAPDLRSAQDSEWQTSGGLILGVAISLVGLYGLSSYLVDRYFPQLDLSELLIDYWWVAFVLCGPALIFKAVQELRAKDAAEGDENIREIGAPSDAVEEASGEAA